MLLKLLVIIMIAAVVCSCLYKRKRILPVGVSISTPPWCPTNVRCDDYMREKVQRAIRHYTRMESTETSPYKFYEQYALEALKNRRDRMKDDKDLYDEWHRVFKIEFNSALPFMQLADREDKPLDHYLKF